MLISHKKKFIFIHIHKTGGTSISSALVSYARLKERISGEFYITVKLFNIINYDFRLPADQGNQWFNGIQKHATATEIKDFVGETRYNLYYKFAFVRNPWDLQVSLYHYIKTTKNHQDYTMVKDLCFKDFLKREIATSSARQTDFITDDKGNIIVDQVCRFETLEVEFEKILKRLDLPYTKLKKVNFSPRESNYRKYYDEESAQLVKNYFKRDIEYFQYEF